jgi:ribosomal protein S18 acetylase RimI-like enzyme
MLAGRDRGMFRLEPMAQFRELPSIAIRELDRAKDRRMIEAIDTSFVTSSVFDLVTSPRTIELVERPLARPLTKRYSIGEVFAAWAQWDIGWVAEADAGVRGFATVQYEAWHARLVLWFLYVAPEWRRRGVGRALLARAEAHGREVGATHVWLETSNVNVPGVAAYDRLGYTLCGADRLFYGSYMPGETAIYLAKMLRTSAG